ncbi:MAG TPA: DUF4395 domain-containing protein [Acidimicrobiales bacterium]|nr:DUF4395 domain-containing protein [Acidimicrobiales bacterium]
MTGGARPAAPRAPGRSVAGVFTFPDPVNEVSARLVAAGVVVASALTIALGLRWGPFVLAYGFVARVAAGPRFSPLGQLVTRVVTPRLGWPPKLVPGPPKRFAQGIGAVVTVTSAALAGTGDWPAAAAVLGLVLAAALLESVLALCVGCKLFALMMRAGWIPVSACERCVVGEG